MEGDPRVGTNALLASAESPEVLSSFGHHIVVELHHYPPFQLPSYAYVQKAPWPPHLSLTRCFSLPLYSAFVSGLFFY